MAHEEGRLYLTVVGATGLPIADFGGTSDPYVIIDSGVSGLNVKKQAKTTIKKKTLSPTWNENFEFTYNYKLRQLKFQAWDWDLIGKDDILGNTKMNVESMMDGCEHVITLPLYEDNKAAGELYLKLKISSPYPVLQPGAEVVINDKSLQLGLGWDKKKKPPVELSASLIALDGAKNLVDQVSSAHQNACGGALLLQKGSGDTKGDDEAIQVDLSKLNGVEYLIFTIHVTSGNLTLANVKSVYIRLLGKDSHKTIAFSRLSNLASKTGLFVGVLKKDAKGFWTFCSVQKGIDGKKWDQSLPEIVQQL